MPKKSDIIHVLLVDDHAIVREGLRLAIERRGGFKVVGEAASGAQAIRDAERLRPDVVLMDVRLESESGLDVCRAIRRSAPAARVLMLSAFVDEHTVSEAVKAGASGYVLKNIDTAELARAIADVAAGSAFFSDRATESMVKALRVPAEQDLKAVLEKLSPGELKVMKLVAEGKTNKEIAAALKLCDNTIKHYLSNLMSKLRLTRRSQVAAFYVRNGDGNST